MNDKQSEMPETVEDQLDFIQSANNLRGVNRLLTQVMAKQKIQALIKDENLATISDAVMDLALAGDGDELADHCLIAG